MRKKVWLFFILGLSTSCLAVEIDLSGAGMQRVAPNMIRLRNVTVPGFGNYWGDFVWDPKDNVFRVANAGPDIIPQLSVTVARFTVARNSAPNLTQACMEEFGPASRQADWQDIKGALGNDNLAIRSFIEGNGIVPGDYYLVTYGRSILTTDGYPYVLQTGGFSGGPKESLGGNALMVGYPTTIASVTGITGKVVCVNLDRIGFPP